MPESQPATNHIEERVTRLEVTLQSVAQNVNALAEENREQGRAIGKTLTAMADQFRTELAQFRGSVQESVSTNQNREAERARATLPTVLSLSFGAFAVMAAVGGVYIAAQVGPVHASVVAEREIRELQDQANSRTQENLRADLEKYKEKTIRAEAILEISGLSTPRKANTP